MEVDILNATEPNRTRCDMDCYIREHLGDRVVQNSIVYTVVYSSLFILGVTGNGLTICVLVSANRLRKWPGVDTYLMNLALTDLIQIFISLPLEIYKYWNQYPWFMGQFTCSIVALISEAALYSSILTITAFTLERYFAVVFPLLMFSTASRSRAWKVISGCWILSLINAAPFAFYNKVNYLKTPDGSNILQASWCAIHYNLNYQLVPLFLYSAVCFYILPLIILGTLYSHIWMVIKRRNNPDVPENDVFPASGTSDVLESPRRNEPDCATLRAMYAKRDRRVTLTRSIDMTQLTQSNKRIFHILLAIIANFCICYGLFHAQRLMFALVDWSDRENARKMNDIHTILFPISGFLYHANPVLDSILYSMTNKKFREAYRAILCCWKPNAFRSASISTIRSRFTTSVRTTANGKN